MRSQRRRKSSKKSSWKFFLILVLILVGLFFYFSGKRSGNILNYGNFTNSLMSSDSLRDLTLRSIPPVVPNDSPTPTPFPLTGYCVYAPVFLYHHVQPQHDAVEKGQTALSVDSEIFDQQMGYLVANGYNFITAKDLIDALRSKSPLPAKSVLLTLDDGYKDGFLYAYPVIQKYNIKANYMIPTGLLEGEDFMSWNDISEMNKSGLIYWTNHSWSHYNMASGDSGKLKFEVETARNQLESHTHQTVDIFTYPYGSFNDLSAQILRSENVVGAFSTIFGDWQCDSFIMALHRRRIGNSPMSYYGF